MGGVNDENDLLIAGKLSADPMADAERAKLHVVKPGDKPRATEPADIAAESALVGALLWAATNAPDTLRVRSVLDILETGEPFYQGHMGVVYDAIRTTAKSGAEHDPVAVHATMVAEGRSVGGVDGIRKLLDEASTVSERQARVYAQAIRDAWTRRQVIRAARALADDARNPRIAPADLVGKAQAIASDTATRVSTSASVVSINESAAAFIKRMVAGKNTAIPTGLYKLDEALNGGLRPGEVSLIAARTNVGKSILSAQIAEHMVTSSDEVGALYVTLEMSHELFTARLLSARSGVPLSNMRKMVLNPTQWSSLTAAAGEISQKSLFYADNPSQTLAAIYASATAASRILAREGKRLGLVVIDHLGLVKPSAESLKKASREQQVAETSRGQRFIAVELGCHVLGIAQIGRGAEQQKGADAMPKLHHLRESGSLEQDADLVFILHRPRDPKSGLFDNSKPAALALAKGRMDEATIILLNYDGARTRFADYQGEETYWDVFGQ